VVQKIEWTVRALNDLNNISPPLHNFAISNFSRSVNIYTLGNLKLAWSYILDYENSKNPYEDRKEQVKGWKKYAVTDIQENAEVLERAIFLNSKGFKKLDSLHIACAIISICDYILTTDDNILKRSEILEGIKVNDPIGFIKEVLS